MPSTRRVVLGVLVTATTSLSGCFSGDSGDSEMPRTASPTPSPLPIKTSHTEPTRTPTRHERQVKFLGTNPTESGKTVAVSISIDEEGVLDDTFQISSESDTTIGEFDEAGNYSITAESNEHTGTETIQIPEYYLHDCRSTVGLIHVYDNDIRIEAERPAVGCD